MVGYLINKVDKGAFFTLPTTNTNEIYRENFYIERKSTKKDSNRRKNDFRLILVFERNVVEANDQNEIINILQKLEYEWI